MPTDTMMQEIYGKPPKTTTDGLQAMKEYSTKQINTIKAKAAIMGLKPDNEHIRQVINGQ